MFLWYVATDGTLQVHTLEKYASLPTKDRNKCAMTPLRALRIHADSEAKRLSKN